MSCVHKLIEVAAKHGCCISRLLSANGLWQAELRDDEGHLTAGKGGTLEAALRDALAKVRGLQLD